MSKSLYKCLLKCFLNICELDDEHGDGEQSATAYFVRSKVSDFQVEVAIEKEVLRLDVAMKNIPRV